MTGSLRNRLLAAASVTTTIVLSLLGGGLFLAVRGALIRDFDRVLLSDAAAVAALVEQEGTEIHFDLDAMQLPEFDANASPERMEYFQIWLEGGLLLARSPSLGTADLFAHAPQPGDRFTRFHLPNGQKARVAVITFTPSVDPGEPGAGDAVVSATRGPTAVIAVASGTTSLDRALAHLRWLLLGIGCAAVILACLALKLVMQKALQPLGDLARQIEAIRGDDHDARLNAADVPSELGSIVHKLNQLLSRINATFLREQAFSSDVAHELRTPLAGLQIMLEVVRSRPRETPVYEDMADKCLVIARRMQSMMENLLLLARVEAGQLTLQLETLQLAPLLKDCWSEFQTRAANRGLEVKWQVDSDVTVRTDAGKMRLILQSLMDNAVSHANVGGTVSIRVTHAHESAAVELSNTGSQIASETVPRLFERFWRADPSRTDTGTHCGLGLAIVQRMARLLSIRVTITTELNGWFRANLSIPTTTHSPAV